MAAVAICETLSPLEVLNPVPLGSPVPLPVGVMSLSQMTVCVCVLEVHSTGVELLPLPILGLLIGPIYDSYTAVWNQMSGGSSPLSQDIQEINTVWSKDHMIPYMQLPTPKSEQMHYCHDMNIYTANTIHSCCWSCGVTMHALHKPQCYTMKRLETICRLL